MARLIPELFDAGKRIEFADGSHVDVWLSANRQAQPPRGKGWLPAAKQQKARLNKYNPDEPRAPAGSSNGGEWTSGGGSSNSTSGSHADHGTSGSANAARAPSRETLLAFRDLSNHYYRQISQLKESAIRSQTPDEKASLRAQADALEVQKKDAEQKFFDALSSPPLQSPSLVFAGTAFKEITEGHFLMLNPNGFVTGPVSADILEKNVFYGPIPGYSPPDEVANHQELQQQITQEVQDRWPDEPAAQKALVKEFGGIRELYHNLDVPEKKFTLRGRQVVAKPINDRWVLVVDPAEDRYSIQQASKLKPAKAFSAQPVAKSILLHGQEQVGHNLLADFPDVRQPNRFACGASSAAAVGHWFGVGPQSVSEWEKILGTTVQESTHPQAIIDYLRKLDLQVEARENMTITDLAQYTQRGWPVICAIQDWGERREEGASFQYGHYITCLCVDHGMVFCQDSSVENAALEPGGDVPSSKGEDSGNVAAPGRVMITETRWLEVWHDQTIDGQKLYRFGIAVGPPLAPNSAPAGADAV